MLKPWLWCAALLGITSLAALGASAVSLPRAESFIVRGNEPFWNVTIDKQGIVYRTPDTKPQTFSYVAPIGAEGRAIDNVRVYRFQKDSLLVLKKTDACSDTMSDKKYPYSATLIIGNTVREGCAEVKP